MNEGYKGGDTVTDLERRVEKIEENCPSQVLSCQGNFKSIMEQLTKGAVKFGRHDTQIKHLEKCADSVKLDVGKIKEIWSKALTGIVVACVLLAINAILFGGFMFRNGY